VRQKLPVDACDDSNAVSRMSRELPPLHQHPRSLACGSCWEACPQGSHLAALATSGLWGPWGWQAPLAVEMGSAKRTKSPQPGGQRAPLHRSSHQPGSWPSNATSSNYKAHGWGMPLVLVGPVPAQRKGLGSSPSWSPENCHSEYF